MASRYTFRPRTKHLPITELCHACRLRHRQGWTKTARLCTACGRAAGLVPPSTWEYQADYVARSQAKIDELRPTYEVRAPLFRTLGETTYEVVFDGSRPPPVITPRPSSPASSAWPPG